MSQPYVRNVRAGRPVGVRALLVASLVLWVPTWLDYWANGGAVASVPYPVLVAALLVANGVLTVVSPRYKRVIVRALQKLVVNPVVRLSLRLRIPMGWALLETTGRRTGRARTTPVGNGRIAETFWIVAEHGAHAAYVKNLRAAPRVRILLRERGLRMAWRSGTAHVEEQADPFALQAMLGGWRHPVRAVNAAIVRVMGTHLLVIRVDLDPISSIAERRARTRAAATAANEAGRALPPAASLGRMGCHSDSPALM